MIQPQPEKLANLQDLAEITAFVPMNNMLSAFHSVSLIADFLPSLRANCESLAGITGCVGGVRSKSMPNPFLHHDTPDTHGTGGDGAAMFNVSTSLSHWAEIARTQ